MITKENVDVIVMVPLDTAVNYGKLSNHDAICSSLTAIYNATIS